MSQIILHHCVSCSNGDVLTRISTLSNCIPRIILPHACQLKSRIATWHRREWYPFRCNYVERNRSWLCFQKHRWIQNCLMKLQLTKGCEGVERSMVGEQERRASMKRSKVSGVFAHGWYRCSLFRGSARRCNSNIRDSLLTTINILSIVLARKYLSSMMRRLGQR